MGNTNLEGQNYTQGEHRIVVWMFLLTAGFLMQVVFMNMLIAIMTSTYDQVDTQQTQSALAE